MKCFQLFLIKFFYKLDSDVCPDIIPSKHLSQILTQMAFLHVRFYMYFVAVESTVFYTVIIHFSDAQKKVAINEIQEAATSVVSWAWKRKQSTSAFSTSEECNVV